MSEKPWYLDSSTASVSSDLCTICRSINFSWLLHNDFERARWRHYTSGRYWDEQPRRMQHTWQSLTTEYVIPELSLGSLSDILHKWKSCSFCGLVAKTIAAKYEIDPDGLPTSEWKRCPFPLVFCTLENHRKADVEDAVYDLTISLKNLAQDFNSFDQVFIQKLNGDRVPFAGARINDQIDFDATREWITQFSNPQNHISQQQDSAEGFRLIDVQNQCVVPICGPQGCRYLALSYVWGGPQSFLNIKARDGLLRRPGSLSPADPELPQTITDAMYFVSRIGERYLWVDSLCIIQDDSSTKMLQINAMDRIYTSALATIVAAYGTSCQAGLHGVRPNSGRWKQHVINIRGIELANRQTLLPGYGPRVWATRGWTYQEHALSKRLIHFAPDGIVFESEDGITNEDVHPPLHNQETAHSFPEGRGLPMGAAVVKALSSLPLLQHFAMAVSFYSMRTLTYQKDGLNAFEGILNVMRLSFRRDFLYGLPSSELDIALLWRPLSGLQRRVHDDTQEALFPTWSWVAWRGRVAFPVYESAHFSRITFVDAEDGTIEFTTRDWRGADTYPDNSSWQRKSLDIDSPPGYFEAGNPHVIYPHPVSKNLPSTVASRKFLKPSSHVLTISAFTASISARPGQGILKMWKKELDIEPDPGVNSRTLEDRFGRFCGTVYIHGDNNNNNNNAPSEESSSPRLYEVVAICRTAYGDANEAWEDPPEDDADVLTLREGYAQRQERRQRSDEWGAAGYWNHYEFELKWKAYDVLVIEWRDDGLAFRVGVGVCFVEAFWDAAPKRKRILLV